MIGQVKKTRKVVREKVNIGTAKDPVFVYGTKTIETMEIDRRVIVRKKDLAKNGCKFRTVGVKKVTDRFVAYGPFVPNPV